MSMYGGCDCIVTFEGDPLSVAIRMTSGVRERTWPALMRCGPLEHPAQVARALDIRGHAVAEYFIWKSWSSSRLRWRGSLETSVELALQLRAAEWLESARDTRGATRYYRAAGQAGRALGLLHERVVADLRHDPAAPAVLDLGRINPVAAADGRP